jgi:hypothetical protein
MKSTIFREKTPCSPLNVNRRFGGTYRLHHQGRTRALLDIRFPAGFLLVLFFDPEDRNAGWLSTDYTALRLGRLNSS